MPLGDGNVDDNGDYQMIASEGGDQQRQQLLLQQGRCQIGESAAAVGFVVTMFFASNARTEADMMDAFRNYGNTVLLGRYSVFNRLVPAAEGLRQYNMTRQINERVAQEARLPLDTFYSKFCNDYGSGSTVAWFLFDNALTSQRVSVHKIVSRRPCAAAAVPAVRPYGIPRNRLPLTSACIVSFDNEGQPRRAFIVDTLTATVLKLANMTSHPANYIIESSWFVPLFGKILDAIYRDGKDSVDPAAVSVRREHHQQQQQRHQHHARPAKNQSAMDLDYDIDGDERGDGGSIAPGSSSSSSSSPLPPPVAVAVDPGAEAVDAFADSIADGTVSSGRTISDNAADTIAKIIKNAGPLVCEAMLFWMKNACTYYGIVSALERSGN